MNQPNNFPCKCGHFISSHIKVADYFENFYDYCSFCYAFSQGYEYKGWNPYHYIQPDNLKYLENKYNESIG